METPIDLVDHHDRPLIGNHCHRLVSRSLIFALTTVVYGVTVPSGLFVPGMTMGALMGRCVGELLVQARKAPC